MANKNFLIKNGLTVGGAEIVNSSGALTQSLITAVPSGAAASTQSVGNSSTAIATTAYVRGEIDALIDSAPGTLNTLNELAAAINDDAAFNTTLTAAVALKAPLASPTFTGTLTASGIAVTGTSTLTGDVTIGESAKILSAGDTDTFLQFNQPNTLRAIIGDYTSLIMNASDTIFNEDSRDINFRIESNNNANMFFVNAGDDKICIGSGNTQSNLSVTGDDDEITMNISTSLSANGTWQGMAFGAHDAMKAGIFYERQTNYARGRLVFAVDATADTSDATLADAAMYINYDKSVSVVGDLDVAGTTKLDGGNGYFRDGVGNSFSSGWDADADDYSTWINYEGYQGGTSRFRDLRIGTGKQASFVHFDGSAAAVNISGTLGVTGASSLSTVLISGVSNYTGLEVKGAGGSRPQVKFTNVNNGVLGSIYGTEGNAVVITSGTSGVAALTLDSSQNATFAGTITSGDKTVSASDPAANSNPSAIGHLWLNSTSGEAYICTVATTNSNQWTNIGDGSGAKPFAGFDLMMIGGGGAGAGELKGGGGAGGLLYFTGFTGAVAYGTSYTITIGAGGIPNAGNVGASGGNTTAFGETAGGGQGGQAGGGNSGTSAVVTSNFITSIGDTSYSGGTNTGNPGAGGAGSAQNGETRPSGNGDGGYGGAGQYISGIYNGSDTYAWAGGGGGPGYGNTEDGGAGGVGGGGGGGTFSEGSPSGSGGAGGAGLNNGDAGTATNTANNGGDGGANTGGGGGGGSHRGGGQSSATGGPGGSGIVCIKQIQTEKAATTTGTVVKTTADGYRYYAFTGSGSITFNS